jgi:hypothetical protein
MKAHFAAARRAFDPDNFRHVHARDLTLLEVVRDRDRLFAETAIRRAGAEAQRPEQDVARSIAEDRTEVGLWGNFASGSSMNRTAWKPCCMATPNVAFPTIPSGVSLFFF